VGGLGGVLTVLLGGARRTPTNRGLEPDFFDGKKLEAADLQSEQNYRRPLRCLRCPISLFLLLTAAVAVVAWAFRRRLRPWRQTNRDRQATDGWPKKWLGPTLKASTNDVAIETLELDPGGGLKTNRSCSFACLNPDEAEQVCAASPDALDERVAERVRRLADDARVSTFQLIGETPRAVAILERRLGVTVP